MKDFIEALEILAKYTDTAPSHDFLYLTVPSVNVNQEDHDRLIELGWRAEGNTWCA